MATFSLVISADQSVLDDEVKEDVKKGDTPQYCQHHHVRNESRNARGLTSDMPASRVWEKKSKRGYHP